MICSSCSKEVRPVVALDIDGTLGDYHRHFMRFASTYLGFHDGYLDAREYAGAEPFRDWFTRETKTDLTTFRQVKLAYRQGGLKRSMPTYAGASGLVDSLRGAGVEVWLTTTRPWERYDRIDPDTVEWLRRSLIEFDGLIYDDDKMKVLSERVDPSRVAAVLDDLLEPLEEASARFGADVPILRQTNFNLKVEWHTAIWDLDDAEDVLLDKVERWEEFHERPTK